jgi:hypothetical protein
LIHVPVGHTAFTVATYGRAQLLWTDCFAEKIILCA